MTRVNDSTSRLFPFAHAVLVLGLWAAAHAAFAGPPPAAEERPDPAALQRAAAAAAAVGVPEGLTLDVFAAEPMVANPAAICLDERGRVFVAEVFRDGHGVLANVNHPFLLADDLANQTVDDRLAMYRRWAHRFPGGADYFTRESDRVRLLTDTDHDGRADTATVFAGGFNDPLDGLGTGVLARDGAVYYTNIPHLWLMRDADHDGRADERKALHRGFGVRCSYTGHDLHGLAWGPDGRLYFSIGDRGYHVVTPEGRTLHDPGGGAVFRCDPDGANLEVFHAGLRNPQELAFDDYGNLFTGDNNSDAGDRARVVYVVEGGDSGWRMNYQTLGDLNPDYARGPWTADAVWQTAADAAAAGIKRPAHTVPPVGYLASGPAGLAHYPGLGLPARYAGHFFLCDVRGSVANSNVYAFAVKPAGAGFALDDVHAFLRRIDATDVEFGYDGRLYVADWVEGMGRGRPGMGRILALRDPARADSPAAAEVARLFREGFDHRPAAELAKLLGHADRRVRQRAQFALGVGGHHVPEVARDVAIKGDSILARLHAVWALGQIGRRQPEVLRGVEPLLADADAEVRAQAATVLGDGRHAAAGDGLVGLLDDPSPRVRAFAAIALGKLRHAAAVGPLLDLIRENADADPFLRHAAVVGLAGAAHADAGALLARADDRSPAVRLGVVVALRRLADARVARFLDDADEGVAAEAARAVYDVPLPDAMPQLAQTLGRLATSAAPSSEPLARRAVNAAYRVGTPEAAASLAAFAAAGAQAEPMRLEALICLRGWASPPARERVLGEHRPLPSGRDSGPARAAVERHLPVLLADGSAEVRTAAAEAAVALGADLPADVLLGWIADPRQPTAARLAALRATAERRDPDRRLVGDAVDAALKADDPRLRAEARAVLARVDPPRGIESLAAALDDGELGEKQLAFDTLSAAKDEAARRLLARWLDRLERGEAPPEVQLDLIEAARRQGGPALAEKLARYEASLPKSDPLAPFRPALRGGDAARGRELFFGHAAAQCARCHRVGGAGGDAGPDLSAVGARAAADREYLLQSLIAPSAKIAQGFDTVTIQLKNGAVVSGTIKSESADDLSIATADGRRVVKTADVRRRAGSRASGMFPMGEVLTPREIRDLIEFLASLK